jgi:hypothetical protein
LQKSHGEATYGKASRMSIGRLRPCHVVCHLIQSRRVGSLCLCCKRPNTCKQSRKRWSCANFSEMLYISHRGVTIPTIFSQFRSNVCVVVCQTERPRDSTTEKYRSSLCIMWFSNCQLGPTSAARDICGMQGAPAT